MRGVAEGVSGLGMFEMDRMSRVLKTPSAREIAMLLRMAFEG
jgi:hypothetical protein